MQLGIFSVRDFHFGVARMLCLMNFGGMPFPLVLESLTLTAREVMPRLVFSMSNEA
jgi:hypothetical protein